MFGKSSAFLHASTSAVDYNGEQISGHHHHGIIPGHYSAAAPPFLESAAALYSQDAGSGADGIINDDHLPSALPADVAFLRRKPVVKKDRHSKIVTSQGPRDRRVRLSIGIARKFFDLQEMLGFDKPSKTLEWLLTKSKAAIKDLVLTKKSAVKSSTSSASDQCEVVLNGEVDVLRDDDIMNKDSGRGLALPARTKDRSGPKTASNVAKESRAKARARARERTKEKMCIKRLNESRTMNNLYQLPSSSCSSHIEPLFDCPLTSLSTSAPHSGGQDLIQESLSIKKIMLKNVPSSSFFGFHQNFSNISRELNCNLLPCDPDENWDIISSLTSQSNLCDVLDPPKFLNRSSNL